MTNCAFAWPGPPSQSLGVDPVDPAIMRKPPRRKDEPIITQRLLYRVLFSATIIVFGTLFIYKFALSDDHMSRREQTMVCKCSSRSRYLDSFNFINRPSHASSSLIWYQQYKTVGLGVV